MSDPPPDGEARPQPHEEQAGAALSRENPMPMFGSRTSAAPAKTNRFRVERRDVADTIVIVPYGELDAAGVPSLEAELLGAIPQTHSILLDLGQLTFVDSCGLWLITLTLNSCRRNGVAFSLTRGPESIRSIFELTGLSDVLPFVEEAR
ncbi:MAG TPA: STAS domain-containing protein [Solirubrobacteraceae bacterium]